MAATIAAHGQVAVTPEAGPQIPVLSSELVQVQTHGKFVREIDDPHTGARWLLIRNPSHPGGPGRLVILEGAGNRGWQDKTAVEPPRVEPRLVLRTGERLIVQENTPVVEARLEAVALGSAAIGSDLDVRLTIGGKVVRAVALAPGRVLLQPETEAWR